MLGLRSRSQTPASKVFLLSGLDHEERKELAKKINILGGKYFDIEDFKAHCTHVVCGRLSRSEKVLGACATGKWVLHPDYLRKSAIYKEWLEEDDFEWCEERFKKDQPLVLPELRVAPRRWRFMLGGQAGAFAGWKVAVVAGAKRSLTIQRLLISGGAQVYKLKLPVKNPEKVANTIAYIFVSRDNVPAVAHLLDYGVLCLKPEFIGEYLIKDPPADPMDFLVDVNSERPVSSSDNSQSFLQSSQSSFLQSPSVSSSQSVLQSSQNSLLQSPSVSSSQQRNDSAVPPYQPAAEGASNYRSQELTRDGSSVQPRKVSTRSVVKRASSRKNADTLLNGVIERHQSDSSEEMRRCPIKMSESQKPCRHSRLPSSQTTSVEIKQEEGARASTSYGHGQQHSSTSLPAPHSPSEGSCRVGKKRKLSKESDLSAVLREMKRQRVSYSEWRPSVFCFPLDHQAEVVRFPMRQAETDIIHSCLEEKFTMGAIQEINTQVIFTYYPQPEIVSALMSQVLLNARRRLEAEKCYEVLMKILRLHPPSTPALQEMYLQAMRLAAVTDREEAAAGGEWKLLKACISCALAGHVCVETCWRSCRIVDNNLLLLKFLVAVIEQNFKHFLQSDNVGGRQKNMLLRILWCPGFHVILTSKCRELLDFLAACLQWTSINTQTASAETKLTLLELLASLVSMMTEYCRLVETGSVEGSVTALEAENTAGFVLQLAQRISESEVRELATLQCLLESLQYDWLRVGVVRKLLDRMDDYLLAEDQLKDCGAISLSQIVTYYFYLLPRFQHVRRASDRETPESPARRQRVSMKAGQTSRSLFTGKDTMNTIDERLANKVNKKNGKGETLLHVTCMKNDVAKLKKLLDTPGVDVNVRDNAGWTPLHEACNHGNIQCVQELLKFVPARTVKQFFKKDTVVSRKVDLQAKTDEGITPLHDAVLNGRLEVCRVLLQHGGSKLLLARTCLNYTPLDLAEENEELLSLLSSFLPNPARRLDMGDSYSSSQESQQSCGETRTEMPSDHLYEQVMKTGTDVVYADRNSLLVYLQLTITLLKSYISLTKLLTIRDLLQSRKCKSVAITASTNKASERSEKISPPSTPVGTPSRESSPLTGKVSIVKSDHSSPLVNTSSPVLDLSVQVESQELARKDLRVLKKIEHHFDNFRQHLCKLSTKEEHAVIEAKLEELSCFVE